MTDGGAGAQRKRRVLVLASTYPRWADDTEPGFVHELSRRIALEDEVMVLAPHATGTRGTEMLDGVVVHRYRYAPAALETLVNDGGIVTNLRRHRWKWLLVPGFFAAMAWSALRATRRWRPDVIHAHWLIPQGVIAAALRYAMADAPAFVVTSHGADLFALRSAPLQALKRWVAKRARVVTVVSRSMRDEAARIGISADPIRVEPMGVDLQARFHPDDVQRSEDELLFVGRLVEKKGLRHLLDAMPGILAGRPGARLSVIGFGPLEAEYRRQVEVLGLSGAVTFHGAVRQAELADHYRRAAVFVAPFVEAASGDREGLGLVLVEAAGCGCPIVVSDVAAIRDVVDGTTASLVPPGNAQALQEACLAALADPAAVRRRALVAREAVRHRFDWSARAKAYAELLRVDVP